MSFCCFKLYLFVHKCGDIYKDDKPMTLYQKSSFQTHQDMEQLHYINMLSLCQNSNARFEITKTILICLNLRSVLIDIITFILLSFTFMNIVILVSINIIENE